MRYATILKQKISDWEKIYKLLLTIRNNVYKNLILSLVMIFFLRVMSYGQTGVFKSYYPDGIPRSEVSYVNDILDGQALYYHVNGNLKTEKNYSKGILHGPVREFYETGLLKEEYYLKDGIKEGSHRIYFPNGALKELNIYEKGILVNRTSFEYEPGYNAPVEAYQAGNRQQQLLEKRKQTVICDVEICPVPIGGMKSIQENLVYPEHALLYGLEGTVTLVASINEKGEAVSTEIVIGLGLGCEEAANDAVLKTPFIPGQNAGITVPSKVTLEIEFKIFDRSLIQNNGIRQEPILNVGSKETKIPAKVDNQVSKISIKCDLDECARPVDGIESISEKFEAPSVAKRLKLKGEIVVEALVDKFGIVRDTKTLKGIGYGCDDALEIAILRTKFLPARSGGIEIESKIVVKYLFNYEEEN